MNARSVDATLRGVKSRLVLVALLAVVIPACGGAKTVESGSQKTSPSRPSTTSGSGSTSNNGSGGSGSSDTLPDLGAVAGSMGSCMEVAGTYASLALGVLEGPSGAAKSQKQAERLKSKLPASLSADIDVVAATFGRIAKDGVLNGAAALEDPAFTKANRNITDYLQSQCGGG